MPISAAKVVALLGFEEGELVAVIVWCGIRREPGLYKLRLMAISHDRRTIGGTSVGPVARATLAEALSRISTDSPGADVFGLIDHRNEASQRVMAEAGFARIDGPVTNPCLEMWAAMLPL